MSLPGILLRTGGAALLLLILLHTVRRDIRYTSLFADDLRNRIVGARLVKDGLDPYTYKWKTGDGVRYYDPKNFDSHKTSVITVSPFFLHMLSPIADGPFFSITRWWLVLEYITVVAIVLIAFRAARDELQKWTVLAFAVLFLLTNGWKQHVFVGQCYIWVPFLFALFYCCLRRRDKSLWGFLAGCCAGCLILFRINALFFLLPFVFLFPLYPLRWKLAFCIAPLLLGAWTLFSPGELGLWKSYATMLDEQIRLHQGLPTPVQNNDPDPVLRHWEGVDKPEAMAARQKESDKYTPELGNVFYLYRVAFHHRIPVPVLTGSCLALVGLLVFVFFVKNRPLTQLPLEKTVLFGCCLYMLSDLFSPVYRYQYPVVQWLFPVLLAAATYSGKERRAWGFLLAGILLASFKFPLVKMPNTTGELLFFIGLLTPLFMRQGKNSQEVSI